MPFPPPAQQTLRNQKSYMTAEDDFEYIKSIYSYVHDCPVDRIGISIGHNSTWNLLQVWTISIFINNKKGGGTSESRVVQSDKLWQCMLNMEVCLIDSLRAMKDRLTSDLDIHKSKIEPLKAKLTEIDQLLGVQG